MRALLIATCAAFLSTAERRFEPKFSLNPPYTAEDNQRWETGAGAKVEENYVRLTPDLPSRTGYLWSRIPVTMTDWETVLEIKIHGAQANGGGEGMAFWFVEKRMLGSVFGSADYWNGVGIFFDTYNNDQQGQSPLITAIYNDGTQQYSAYDDGQSQALGSCHVPSLRNPSSNIWTRITYLNKQLTLDIASNLKGREPDFHRCFTVQMELGLDKFFGVTAHTGQPIAANQNQPQISDNHDVIAIITHDLSVSNSEQELQRRRDAYKQEVEEKHKQNSHYHKMSSNEFKHAALTLINQIASTTQVLDVAQVNIVNMLNVGAEGVNSAGAQAGEVMNEIREIEKQLAISQQALTGYAGQLGRLAQGGGGGGGGGGAGGSVDPNAVETYREWATKQQHVFDALSFTKTHVDTLLHLVQTNQGGGGIADPVTLRQSAMDAATQVTQRFKPQLDKYTSDSSHSINNLQRSLEALSSKLDSLSVSSSSNSSGGGIGIFTWILVFILVAEVVAMCWMQMKSGKSQYRDKLV